MNFYLWDYIKNEVYSFEPTETKIIKESGREVMQKRNGNTFRLVCIAVERRYDICLQQGTESTE